MKVPNQKVRRTKSRALEMIVRDAKSGFGSDYVPAIRVTRREAPSQSCPSLLFSSKLNRDLHLLSLGELGAAIRALFLPETEDVHEQKMLQLFEAQHPLARHPEMVGHSLPNVPGTTAICVEMGSRHPIARDDLSEEGEERQHMAFPYVGDLLLVLRTGSGLLRCVNWNIKRSRNQFGTADHPIHPANSQALSEKNKAHRRLEIDRLYYAAADIPTYPIAFDDLNRIVTQNLLRLMMASSQAINLDNHGWIATTSYLESAIDKELSINATSGNLAILLGIPVTDAANLVQRAIWEHRVQVDLYTNLLPDRPLRRPKKHLVDEIRRKWTGGQACN